MHLQESDSIVDLAQQVVSHGHCQVVLHDNSEHGLLGGLIVEEWHAGVLQGVMHGHVVATDIPMSLGDNVLQVNLIVAQRQLMSEHRRHHWKTQLLAALAHRIDNGEEGLACVPVRHLHEALADELTDGHLVCHLILVPAAAKSQELVELHVHTLGGPREVQRVGVGLATQVGHGDGHVLTEVLAPAPDDPAGAAAALAELVAAGGDGDHCGQAEVPGGHLRLEGRREASRGRVHVDANLHALLLVELLQHGVNLPDWVVLASVVVAQDGHHADGVLVDERPHVLRAHGKGLVGGRDKLRLDVHVAEQLLPARLEARGDDEVGEDAPDLLVVLVELLLVPLPPPELHAQPREEAGLRGAHRARPREGAVLVHVHRHRAVPEPRHHIQHVVVHLEAFRVDSLVRKVNLQPHLGCLHLLLLEEDVDVGGGVQGLLGLQQVAVLDHPQDVPSRTAPLGNLVVIMLILDGIKGCVGVPHVVLHVLPDGGADLLAGGGAAQLLAVHRRIPLDLLVLGHRRRRHLHRAGGARLRQGL
mmetsp:Transcript_100500/g.292952  ORF Transcript_100500/g.292952 Transcript_100500/m.292952 type:complete len:531 (-) Transcript_100500:117-1709(-)